MYFAKYPLPEYFILNRSQVVKLLEINIFHTLPNNIKKQTIYLVILSVL